MAIPYLFFYGSAAPPASLNFTIGVNTENLLGIEYDTFSAIENLGVIDYDTGINTENLLEIDWSGNVNTENTLGFSIDIDLPHENTPLGAPRNITGGVRTKFFFNFIENYDGFVFNDVGNIDHTLPLASGLGNGEISELFYETESVNGENSYNLSNLDFTRFDMTPYIIFTNCRRLKGISLKNNSGSSMYLKVPYYNTLDYTLIPPSGETLVSNNNGWVINSGDYIYVSGSGTYSIAFLG